MVKKAFILNNKHFNHFTLSETGMPLAHRELQGVHVRKMTEYEED